MGKYLIHFGQWAREGNLVTVSPDDTARGMVTTTDQSCLSEGVDALVGIEEAV